MRAELAEKIEMYYGSSIRDLTEIINACGDIIFWAEMYSNDHFINEALGSQGGKIFLSNNPLANAVLILKEIVDDYTAALSLYSLGFFKQARQILRNTIELIFQLLYNYLSFNNSATTGNDWMNSVRGVERVFDISKELEKTHKGQIAIHIRELAKLYNLINSSVHSHKDEFNSTNSLSPSYSPLHTLTFDTLSSFDTIRIFFFCLINEFEILSLFFKTEIAIATDSDFQSGFSFKSKEHFFEHIRKIILLIDKYKIQTTNYKKGDFENGSGILLFQQHFKVGSKQVRYTLLANGKILYLNNVKGLKIDHKTLRNEIDFKIRKENIQP